MSPSFQNPPGRLSPEREAEIVTRRQQVPAGPWRVEPCAEEATKYCLCIVSRRTEDDGVEYIADAETPGLATWIAHAREDIDLLLAELDAVRAERDMYRDRALDAENRSIVDGREVCADCERPVPDPCTVHSPDAVFQRAAREAAQLRVDRDRARARVAELRRYVARLEAAICQCEPEREHSDYRRWSDYQHAVDCPAAEIQMRTLGRHEPRQNHEEAAR